MLRIFRQYVSIKSLLLVLLEAVLIAAGVIFAARVRFWYGTDVFEEYIQAPGFLLQCLTVVLTFQICFYYNDFYNPQAIRGRIGQLICVTQALGAGCLILGLAYLALPDLLLGRGVLMLSLFFIALLVIVSRICLDRVWDMAAPREKILILGTGNLALRVAGEYTRRGDLSAEVVGFVAAQISIDAADFGYPVFGGAVGLETLAARHDVDKIIVALEDRRGVLPIRDLVKLRVQGIRVEDAHTTISSLSGRVWLDAVKPSWFVFTDGFNRSKITLALKRLIDIVFACVGLVVSLPIMVIVAVAVWCDSKGPVFYRQQRVGYRGRCFDVLKFRSMRTDAEAYGARWASAADPRTTRVGKVLRKYRFDELPQFVNVIRGEMSFVGPRPERPVFVEQIRQQISYYDERHSVRPGLTGWAQVQYPYGASIEDAYCKLEYDLFYLQNMSVFFDCAIILKTIRTVFAGVGAEPVKRKYDKSEATRECLTGINSSMYRMQPVAAGETGQVLGVCEKTPRKENVSPGGAGT